MSPYDHFPREYAPEVLTDLESAYSDVWNTLYKYVSPSREASTELGIRLSQVLASLATEGVTDPKELRRRALETMALTIS